MKPYLAKNNLEQYGTTSEDAVPTREVLHATEIYFAFSARQITIRLIVALTAIPTNPNLHAMSSIACNQLSLTTLLAASLISSCQSA